MKKIIPKSIIFLGLAVAVLGFGNYLMNQGGLERIISLPNQEEVVTETTEDKQGEETSPTTNESQSYSFEATVSGQTAFELLLNNVSEVKYTEYDFGTFIEGIEGVAGDNENFWAFYLNGEKAQTGADVTVLEEGDKVQFIYEKIEF